MKYSLLILLLTLLSGTTPTTDRLKEEFKNPPETSKPGVYWYFMDGNLSKTEMTKDLESMKAAGINNLIFLEVGIGVPRGPVDFMSEEWQQLFVHAVREAERLNIQISMGAGPGWCGSGGPWVKPEESMKHLVFSETEIAGNNKINIVLPVPEQRKTPWHNMKDLYYKDVVTYAIPVKIKPIILNINEKALYERYPYSSYPNVNAFLPAPAKYKQVDDSAILHKNEIIDISKFVNEQGQLVWDVPAGNWTIIRMGLRVTGASTRPAPEPAIGLESDKLSAAAFEHHLNNFTDILLKKVAPLKAGKGWTGFHMDSWESGSQNWTEGIAEEFKKRRGYDPAPYYLAYTGRAITNIETTERFLWDIRKTCQELLLQNHAEFAKTYAHKNGLVLTIEPYDMNPAGDLDLGAVADVIMAEFWSKRFGFDTHYAVVEATSISHITGQPIVGAEAFTSHNEQAWQEYPWSMKDQSDWALALGVNRFIYHTFAHKPLGDKYRPGMTMGRYGVHWDRGQTWWPMVGAYHKYISRASHLMQQGQGVSDILYLTPEGAPMVFTPPADAMETNGKIPDKKGYGFDGCSPKMLIERADVSNGKIVFPGASSYELMVLPNFKTMTPELLEKITSLVEKGATIIGIPPAKSPSLVNYPSCDIKVKLLAEKLWGTNKIPAAISKRLFGKGEIYWGGTLSKHTTDSVLYPSYAAVAEILLQKKIREDFHSKNNSIRYGHRKTADRDIYFIANRTDSFQTTTGTFRAVGTPELWCATTGEIKKIKNYSVKDGLTSIPLEFFPSESYFLVFSVDKNKPSSVKNTASNFIRLKEIKTLEGAWNVSFNNKMGGPKNIQFKNLQDWTTHEMRGIKFYSGIATYKKTFTITGIKNEKCFIDLGTVHDMASVKLNGKDLGVIWCAPWRLDISNALKEGSNALEIQVANRWINRLLGDRQAPDSSVRTVKFDNGLLGGQTFKTGRYTFTTEASMRSFKFKEPLPSGLLGPVKIEKVIH